MSVEAWARDMGLSACDMVGAELAAARAALEVARDRARGVALANVAEGVPEAAVARHIGVSRGTIRKWRASCPEG
jgi:hypothetical protein